MTPVEEAIIFATKAHSGQTRRMAGTPYILHPLEVATIIATITDDREVLMAGILHDTIEDCDVSPETIAEKFGQRVCKLVLGETEERVSGESFEDTWMYRKSESIKELQNTKDIGVKTMWLADKLSNIRSFYREYQEIGDGVFDKLHQKDPKMHEWYYRSIAEALSELSDTAAYKEYCEIVDKLFKQINNR